MTQRFVKPPQKWGKRKKIISILLPPQQVQALDRHAEQLTEKLGRRVTRSLIISDYLTQDVEVKTIVKQLKKEKRDGRYERERTERRTTD